MKAAHLPSDVPLVLVSGFLDQHNDGRLHRRVLKPPTHAACPCKLTHAREALLCKRERNLRDVHTTKAIGELTNLLTQAVEVDLTRPKLARLFAEGTNHVKDINCGDVAQAVPPDALAQPRLLEFLRGGFHSQQLPEYGAQLNDVACVRSPLPPRSGQSQR